LILYLDTSAFLKLYLAEPGSKMVHAAVEQADAVFMHRIGYTEMRAGLARAARYHRLDERRLADLKERFESDWQVVRVVGVSDAVVRRAAVHAERYGLRAYDSVHLAAAEQVAELTGGTTFRFAVYDGELARTARQLGLNVPC